MAFRRKKPATIGVKARFLGFMRWCPCCENCRWVCENHPDRPWEGIHACTCGGAGAPCPICNATDELSAPKMPEGFQADVVNKDWKAMIEHTTTPHLLAAPATMPMGVARTEADHHMKCPACGQWFDIRDLGQVMQHVHGETQTAPARKR